MEGGALAQGGPSSIQPQVEYGRAYIGYASGVKAVPSRPKKSPSTTTVPGI